MSNVEPTPAKAVSLAEASPLSTQAAGIVQRANVSPVDTIAFSDALSDSSVGASPVKQTPPKTVLPMDYDPTTGWTPAGANVNEWRVGWPRPGVPGETEVNSFNLETPNRDKKK